MCKLGNGTLSKLSEKTRESTIDRIIDRCPDLNRVWLLTGEGAMLNEAAAHGNGGNAAATSEKKHTILYYPNVDGTMGGVQFLDWGKIYLVVTRSGYRVIKRLLPGKTETTIVCRSENTEANPDFEIELADILTSCQMAHAMTLYASSPRRLQYLP